ncbi:MAG: hypothetical protein P9E24_14410 [Candidatus Competibacter sp.]|nr:hypothetical protein [Candidatus Competibacter sp.]MDG4583945.1 hypothetical protein [Candidatus Competibacter sp.]
MRLVDPFGVNRKSNNESYIDINAKVQIFEGGGGPPRTHIFTDKKIGGYQQPSFIPLVVEVQWGKTDRIRIEIETIYNFKHDTFFSSTKKLKGNGSGRLHWFEEWTITYPEEGLLVDHLKSRSGTGIIQHKGELAIAASYNKSQSPQGITGPFIAIDAELAITKPEKSGQPVAIDGNLGPINISSEIEIGGSPSESGSVSYELKAFLSVVGRPKTESAPKPLEVPEDLLTHNVYFEEENQKHLSHLESRRLEDQWTKPLFRQSPKLYNAIKSGKCQIWLSGYTSTTGKEANNKNLSKDRITSVEEALKTDLFKSKNVKFVRLPQGEKSSTQKGAVARERRVEIQIQQWEAIMAMV